MIKILFLDIDGTIIDPKTGNVSGIVKKTLLRAREAGIKLILVTGRAPFAVTSLAKELSIPSYIANNGGVAVVDGVIIYQQTIDKRLLDQFISYSHQYNDLLLLSGFGRYNAVFKANPLIASLLKRIKTGGIIYSPDYYKDHDIYQIDLITSPAHLIDYKKTFADEFRFYPWHVTENAVHVNPVNTSKAFAAEKILNHLSSNASCTAAIGDGLNDLEMIQAAQIGIAMGNACQEVKEAATFITENVSQDGAATAINRLIRSSEWDPLYKKY